MSPISRRELLIGALQVGSRSPEAWIDGDLSRLEPDYTNEAIVGFRRLGLGMDAPRRPGDPGWEVWLEFNRQRFRDRIRTRTDTLHREGRKVCATGIYSSLMPEKPEIPIDFLSGAPTRLDTRYLAATGKPWGAKAKTPYKSALVDSQTGTSLSDIAVLFSRNSLYRTTNRLFGDWGEATAPCTRILDTLISWHRSVDIQPDWAPIQAPVLIIPDWPEIGDSFAASIVNQIREGLSVFTTNSEKFARRVGFRDGVLGKGRFICAPDLTESLLNTLAPPQIQLGDRTAPVELSLRRKDSATVLHFVARQPHLKPLRVQLRLTAAPKKLIWEPAGKALPFDFSNGVLSFSAPPVRTHAMAVVL